MRKSAILAGGLIASTVDIGAAMLISGLPLIAILHVVASGLVGREAAAQGGIATACLGMALQWVMGLIIAAIYAGATSRFPKLRQAWIVTGILYGAVIFVVMNFVVVPLSALHVVPHFSPGSFGKNMAAMLLFGLIVAFFGRD